MIPLFVDWERVAHRLRSAPVIALFLDFDGTLSLLRPRPDQATLHDSLRPVLSALAHCPRFRLWVISGRRLEDVRARIHVRRIRYLGLHGWETGAAHPLDHPTRALVPSLRNSVASALAESPGVWVEDKQYAFTVHYGQASEADADRARTRLEEALAPHSRQFRIEPGHNVWEVLPREIGDKGRAVRRELAFLPDPAVPVYIGDDRVDEAAFAQLREGITIRVGRSRWSRARYKLGGVAEVSAFLSRLREEFA